MGTIWDRRDKRRFSTGAALASLFAILDFTRIAALVFSIADKQLVNLKTGRNEKNQLTV